MKALFIIALLTLSACATSEPIQRSSGSWDRACRQAGGVVYTDHWSTKCVDRQALSSDIFK